MGEIHCVMGSVLILLHTIGVWIFSRSSRESLHTGHHWADSFSCGHCFAFLCCLQRRPNLSYGLQANPYCSAVNFFPLFHSLLPNDDLILAMIQMLIILDVLVWLLGISAIVYKYFIGFCWNGTYVSVLTWLGYKVHLWKSIYNWFESQNELCWQAYVSSFCVLEMIMSKEKLIQTCMCYVYNF